MTQIEYYNNVKEKFPQYLDDESGIVRDGFADRIFFPKNEAQIIDIIKLAKKEGTSISISGAGTGLSGGRVPQGGWIIATDKVRSISTQNGEIWIDPETNQEFEIKLQEIDQNNAFLTVPISISLKAIQNLVRQKNWFYPPDPTERSSFIGGNVSTNASGARSFKFGATRRWVQRINVVLANGELLKLDRAEDLGIISQKTINIKIGEKELELPRPSYNLPKVTKHVAGPVIKDDSHPMDLFIGSNGIFGIITEVTLKLKKNPTNIISIFAYCGTINQAFQIIDLCQSQRENKRFPIPMSVEFLDDRAIKIMRDRDSRIPKSAEAVIMLEQDVYDPIELENAIVFWDEKFDMIGIFESSVAQSYKEIEHHKLLRHYVPEYIISFTKRYNQSLIATDTSCPKDVFEEFFYYLLSVGHKFEKFQNSVEPLDEEIGYVFFGHAGDCHPHLALLPRNDQEYEYGQSLLVEVIKRTVDIGGSIASEHGLGKKEFDGLPALYFQYGDDGLNEVKELKKLIDPENRLCPRNLTG